MYTLKEGEKRTIRGKVRRRTGAGPIVLTSPMRRIVDSARVLIVGFDWSAAAWDASTNEISALFDSMVSGLTPVGTYYVDLRGVIGAEVYAVEVEVVLENLGP